MNLDIFKFYQNTDNVAIFICVASCIVILLFIIMKIKK